MNIKEQFVAYKTICLKEMIRILRIWTQSLMPPAVMMTLYFVVFGRLIGSQIRSIHGFSYIEYITPGLIMMPVITAAYLNTVSSFFMAKFQRSIEEMQISPMPNYIILLGFVSGGVFRAFLISIIVTIVALFFTHLHIQHIALTLLMILLTAILFALAGITNAIFATKFDDISFVPTFILTPLTYLGGVFYSIKLLPTFWYHVSLFNPILHIVNAFRFGILGITDVNIWFAFGMVGLFVVVLFALNLYLLRKGIGLRS